LISSTFMKEYMLHNGLRVLLAENKSTPSVTVMLAVKSGSRYETESTSGLAHFSEHLFFKGTKNYPDPLSIVTAIESLGAEVNAFTAKEYTGFYIKSLSTHLPSTMEILYDLVFRALFRPEDIDRERGVIVEEIRMYKDTPRDYIYNIYFNHIYPNHPLGWDTAGEEETVANLKKEDFSRYLEQYYVPTNIVLCVAGSFDESAVRSSIDQYFGSLSDSGGNVPPCLPVKESFQGPPVKVFSKDNEQAHLILGVPAYPHQHPDRFGAVVLNAILGGGMGSRLFSEVREKRSLAYYVHSTFQPFMDTGTLYAAAGVDVDRLNEAVGVIYGQFKALISSSFSQAEFERARELVKGRLILGLEETNNLAWFFLNQALFQEEILLPEEVLSRLDRVLSEDTSRIAEDLLARVPYKLAVLGPYHQGEVEFQL